MAISIIDDLKALKRMPFTNLAIQSYIIDIMENFFYSMFDYKNFPESMPKEYAERYFIWYGMAGAGKVDIKYNSGLYKGENVFLHAQTTDEPDIYGLGSKCIVTGCNGFNDVADYDKYAIGFNNSAHTNLRDFICMASDAITKALSSLRSGVLYSKNHPIYKARDDKEKASLTEYWKKVVAGEDDLAIASSNIQDDFIESINGAKSNPSSNVINLSDALTSDKLQYISKVIDDYMRWCFGLYGQTIQGNGKMAQQTVDEVNGQTSTSFILPNDMLYQRKLWVERMKKLGIVGEDADIDFSTAWKVEEVKYQKEADVNEDGELTEVTDETIEPEGESETQPQEEENNE